MNRSNLNFAAIVAATLLVVLHFVTGWRAAGVPERPFLSGLSAVLLLVAAALLLYLTNDRIINEKSHFAPFIYLMLAAANPAALYLTTMHAAAILMAVSLYSYLRFSALAPDIGQLVIAWATLGAAALFFPPLAWLAPIYAATMTGRTEDKPRYWVAAILSLVLPVVLLIGVDYLLGRERPVEVLGNLWEGMTAIARPSFPVSAATLCRILLTVLVTVVASVRILGNLTRYRTVQYHALFRLLILSLSLGVLALLFTASGTLPFGLVVMLPVSLILNEYFRNPEIGHDIGTLGVVLLLVMLAERIAFYV